MNRDRNRIKKYVLSRSKGLSKAESARAAGYTESTAVHATSQIEKTKEFSALAKRYFKDELLEQITLKEIATNLKDNITQDKDRGARNQAIKLALEKIEPTDKPEDDENQKVLVVLRG